MSAPVNLLPGPVEVRPEVIAAFARSSFSHRSEAFADLLADTRRRLRRLTGARRVEIALGSGTLANDMIAAQLGREDAGGLILSNGEFGDRLVDHARRAGLRIRVVTAPWGERIPPASIRRALRKRPAPRWLWAVHCETSTGLLNDLGTLKALAADSGARLCLDCVSTLGTMEVDLSGVHLASGVSGKGLASLPGLGLIFSDHAVDPSPGRIPRVLDLGLYFAAGGVPFTGSSNLLSALRCALRRVGGSERFERIAALSRWLRRELSSRGLRILVPAALSSPAVLTLPLDGRILSTRAGSRLESEGFLVHYRSEYLRRRNWIQICLMGEISRDRLAALPSLLSRIARPRQHPRIGGRAVPASL